MSQTAYRCTSRTYSKKPSQLPKLPRILILPEDGKIKRAEQSNISLPSGEGTCSAFVALVTAYITGDGEE